MEKKSYLLRYFERYFQYIILLGTYSTKGEKKSLRKSLLLSLSSFHDENFEACRTRGRHRYDEIYTGRDRHLLSPATNNKVGIKTRE